MKAILTLLFIAISIVSTLAATCAADETKFKDKCLKSACAKILDKMKEKESQGKKQLPIKFDITSTFNAGTSIDVTLSFPDKVKAEGLLKQDNPNSCVTSQLLRYKFGFTDETVDTSAIVSSYDETTFVRQWKFTIPMADWNTKLTKDVQSDKVILRGFYGLLITVEDKKILYHLFTVRIVLNKDMTQLIETGVESETQGDSAGCVTEDKCVKVAQTKLEFCTDATCATIASQPTLVVGQKVYVKQTVIETGLTTWRVKKATIYVTGDNVAKKLKPTNEVQADGYTIYEFTLKFVAINVKFTIKANVAKASATRILQTETESADASAVGTSTSISCILKAANEACPTQAEVETYNQPDCGDMDTTNCTDESSYGTIMTMTLTILALLII